MTNERFALLDTRRREAVVLFNANQAARRRAEQTLLVSWLVLVSAAAVAIVSGNKAVLIPLAPAQLLLWSWIFQQYADITVIGAARARLEHAVNLELGGPGLIYESLVAEIRKRPPLVRSVRLLQGLSASAAPLAVVFGAIAAFGDQPTWVPIAFAAATAATATSSALSYRAMLRSGRAATAAIDAPLRAG